LSKRKLFLVTVNLFRKCGRNIRQNRAVPIRASIENSPISCNKADDVNIRAAKAPMVVKQPMVRGVASSLIILVGELV
jgi:hypothetical protein